MSWHLALTWGWEDVETQSSALSTTLEFGAEVSCSPKGKHSAVVVQEAMVLGRAGSWLTISAAIQMEPSSIPHPTPGSCWQGVQPQALPVMPEAALRGCGELGTS